MGSKAAMKDDLIQFIGYKIRLSQQNDYSHYMGGVVTDWGTE